jgi:2-polyprenyl-3-methyl-5-hydroxy-6-metoxy-1,4-benzoquinol methylase
MENNSIYKPVKTKCPLCENSQISDHFTIERYKYQFKTSRCNSCKFIFMNPQFTEEIINNMYDMNYYSGNSDYSYLDEREIFNYSEYVWNSRIDFINRYIPGGNFLDIGSSFGGLLQSARKKFIPYGIELSEYSAQYSKKFFGENIHNGTLENHNFKYSSMDVITMIELIEHLENPVKAIIECYKLLKKNGLLVIQTANMEGLQAKMLKNSYAYYMPGHLSYFSKSNLLWILEQTGFSKIEFFHPVEFGLIPKLKKSSNSFKSILDYKAWFRISFYHLISKIHFGNFAVTSSMVVYASK